MNIWPDGALRWVELDALLTAADATEDGRLWLDMRGNDADSACVLLRQLRANQFEVLDENGAELDQGKSAPGWLSAVDARHSLMMHVRHFRQQFPKALEWQPGQFRIALFEAMSTSGATTGMTTGIGRQKGEARRESTPWGQSPATATSCVAVASTTNPGKSSSILARSTIPITATSMWAFGW